MPPPALFVWQVVASSPPSLFSIGWWARWIPPPPTFLLAEMGEYIWEDAMRHGVALNAMYIQNKLHWEGESYNGIWREIVKSICRVTQLY